LLKDQTLPVIFKLWKTGYKEYTINITVYYSFKG
jgi:hypothetical protein